MRVAARGRPTNIPREELGIALRVEEDRIENAAVVLGRVRALPKVKEELRGAEAEEEASVHARA